MDILCVVNQKGGVGKTTTSINLAVGLARLGQKVLLVDMDPQANASSGLGIRQDDTLYHVLIGQKILADVIVPTSIDNLSLVPANGDLAGAEVELMDTPQREYVFKKALSVFIRECSSCHFDHILIDCPPSLNLLTINALVAAHRFIVPLQCEYYALEGLSQLLTTVSLIQKRLNKQLQMQGILLTMFDMRNKLSHQIEAEARDHFGEKVFKTLIPRNVKLSEAPSHGLSIFDYDSKSVGALCYRKLAREFYRQIKQEDFVPSKHGQTKKGDTLYAQPTESFEQ